MNYSFTAATFANADSTAAICQTKEAGAVLLSSADTPDEWVALMAWGTPQGFAQGAPPVIVPTKVFAYQFAGQAAYEGIITEAEGKAWAGAGTVPASLQAAVDKLVTDVEAHDRVTFFLVGATEFPRYHPNTIALAPAFGKGTPEELDAFFIAAGER